jgi:uncharacterized membrane protein
VTTLDQVATRRSAVPRYLRAHRDWWPLWGLMAIAFAVYSVFSVERHNQFGTAGYDLGIFDQAVRAYAHFKAPIVPLKGMGYNILGDHFHPIIALGAPFYWIWDDPRTLLILQAALIAASVPVVYRFAHRRVSAGASLVLAYVYAFGWGLQTLANFNFHEVAWGVPILALAIDALDRHDDRQLLIFAGLLLLVREDMGMLVILMGLLRLAWRPRRLGVVLIVAGAVGYELATAVILPHFAPGGKFAYWEYGPTLGKNLPDAVGNMITRPWHAIDLFFSPWVKSETILLLFAPVLLLPLRSRYTILVLPLLAQRFFEPVLRKNLWYPAYHYNALPWVILMLATIDGAARLGLFDRERVRLWLLSTLAAVTTIAIAWGPSIAGRNVFALHSLVTGKLWASSPIVAEQNTVIAQIPANVCVEADDRLSVHLTNRDYVTLPPMQHGTADFVVLDLSQKDVGNFGPKPTAVLQTDEIAGYTAVYSVGHFVVLRSPNYAGPSSECHPLGAGH